MSLLAVVDIPRSYKEIVNLWQTEAIDKYEHIQLVALPLRALRDEDIENCLKFGQLEEAVRDKCVVVDRRTFDETTRWDLHPTSPVRLATALWLEMYG